MADELKPVRCGCGGEAIAYIESMDGGFWHRINVSCSKCGIRTPKYDTEAEAIQAWNRAMGATDKNVGDKDYLIRRQDVIDALELSLENDYVDATEFLAFVKQLPSAEPERKKGEWVEKDVFTSTKGRIKEWQSAKCSVCGKYHTTPYLYYFGNYNFCPNCGADMEDEE